MNLITQGKTNYQYLAIVVIIGFVVGLGILGYYFSWIADLDARLSTLELKMSEDKMMK